MIQARPGQSFWGSAYRRITDVFRHFLPAAIHQPLLLLVFIAAAVIVGVRRPQLLLLLTAPFVTAVILAIARVTPLGGGVIPVNGSRVDVYLYPSLALLLAAGVDQSVRLVDDLVKVRAGTPSSWVAPSIIVVAAIAVLLSASRSSYPRSDTKAFIRYLDANARPGDTIAMNTDARSQYVLYTRWPVAIHLTKRSELGFTADVSPPGIDIVAAAKSQNPPTSARVFLLASRNDRLVKLLRAGGYRRSWDREAPGATLQLWVK